MNAAEDRLSELMDAATCALDPPVAAILAAGERLGRARRRRRHITVATGTAAVVLLAGAGVVAGMRDTDPGDRYDAAGHLVPDSRAPTDSQVPSLAVTAPVPKPGQVPIDATAAVNILRELVAANWKFGAYKTSSTGSLLRVNVDDGKGAALITVRIATVANPGIEAADCSQQGIGAATVPAGSTVPAWTGGASPSSGSAPAKGTVGPNGPECYVARSDNGDKVMSEVLVSPPSRVVIDRVIAKRSDGIAVEITAQNGPASTFEDVTRAWPPLDVGKWALVALNPMWQLYVPAPLAK